MQGKHNKAYSSFWHVCSQNPWLGLMPYFKMDTGYKHAGTTLLYIETVMSFFEPLQENFPAIHRLK